MVLLDEAPAAAAPDPHWIPPEFRAPKLLMDAQAWEAADVHTQEMGREVLAEINELLERNPMLVYEAAGAKHHAFHLESRPRSIRVLGGGNRAGKTTTGVCDSLIEMTPRALLPEHLLAYKRHDCERSGPFELRCVVPDMVRTGDPIKAKFKQWTPKELMKGRMWMGAWREKEARMTLECGCFMELLSTEMDLDKHGGTARHRIHFDEEPPQDYFNENMLRLADYGGDAMVTMTPLQGLTWAFTELWKKRGTEGVSGITIGMRDNRHLTPEDIAFVLARITNEAERRQREFGEFADRGGPIYPNFMDALADHPSRERIAVRQVVCAIDPGLNFAGLVWIAFDRDNNAFVFASVKIERGDVDEYVRRIGEVNRSWGVHPTYVIDPASSAGNLVDGQSVMDALARRGIHCVPGLNAVEAGISEVRRRLNGGSLRISRKLISLQDEAIEYAAEDRDDGVFQPVKRNDHLLDALRYGLMYRPWLAPPQHRVTMEGNGQFIATGPPKRTVPETVMGWGA